jgi:hypothetical protein
VTLSDIDKKVRVVNFKVSKSKWKKDGGTEEALVKRFTRWYFIADNHLITDLVFEWL